MGTTLTFLGAAGTVTGSKYLLETTSWRVLLDCGLFQGECELRRRNWDLRAGRVHSAHGTAKHRPALPLSDSSDSEKAIAPFAPLAHEDERALPGGITVTLRRAGHILGSAFVELDAHGVRLVVSGDLGRPTHPLGYRHSLAAGADPLDQHADPRPPWRCVRWRAAGPQVMHQPSRSPRESVLGGSLVTRIALTGVGSRLSRCWPAFGPRR